MDGEMMRALADEVEGSDALGAHDLDLRIVAATQAVEIRDGLPWWIGGGALSGQVVRTPHYARSVDDAAALMPAGVAIKIEHDPSVPGAPWQVQAVRVDRPPHYVVNGHARTEALARTAAGLRAIAADLGAETDV